MLLRQMQYFAAVVRLGSFSEAAEECHISQSAISQQMKALENDLGVQLLARHNRTFTLTPAGEVFYRRAAAVLQEVQQLRKDVVQAAQTDKAVLNIGYANFYGGGEFQLAVGAFAAQYPNVELHIIDGSHEDLYDALRTGKVDLVLNDQRRAFSDEYVNLELALSKCYVQIAANNRLAVLPAVDIEALADTPCILIAQPMQQENEATYYRDIIGFKGQFLFAKNMQEARMLVAAGRGVMPIEGVRENTYFDTAVKIVPLLRKGKPILRKYCAFWKQDNSGYYVETFAEMLHAEFER